MARTHRIPTGSLADFVDGLQARGRYTFTRETVAKALGGSAIALEAGLRRLRARRRLASPRRGFHMIVPVEYREAGCPPATWFIDDLMRYLVQPYYVGLLSAASFHGAAHQQPMVFQVVTDRPTRPARAGRVRIAFHMSRSADSVPVSKVQTETGTMRVSTPETTALDLVRFAGAGGHLGNVATVLTELAERLAVRALVDVALHYSVPDVQRLGYLLDLVHERELADALAQWLSERRFRPVLLARGQPEGRAKPDPRWRVIPNAEVEADT